MDDLDGVPLVDPDIDGVPLEKDNIDGEPSKYGCILNVCYLYYV